jgi:hypothetical protein
MQVSFLQLTTLSVLYSYKPLLTQEEETLEQLMEEYEDRKAARKGAKKGKKKK